MERRIISAAGTAGGCDVRLVDYPPRAVQQAHAHARGSITLVLRGELVERRGRDEERASALSVVGKPAGIEHADAFGPEGATTLQVELPGAGAPLDMAAALPAASTRWDHAGPACASLLRLLGLLRPEARPLPSAVAEELVCEALAALQPASSARGAAPAWLLDVRAALAEEPAPVASLARRAGVHPVYLARRFRDQFGLTPSGYRARMRVHRAAHRIARPGEPLADVALDAGYFDQPHMNHAVRSATGVTPRMLRRLALAVVPAPC